MIGIVRADGVADLMSRLKSRSVALDSELLARVGSIVDDVRERGDEALIDYGRRFDGVELRASELRVDEETLRRSAGKVDSQFVEALRTAIANVRAFHERQVEQSWEFSPAEGVRLGQRITPLESVGLYVPGGTAAYPSSIVMNVVPAQVAHVERIVVTTPPRTLAENPAVAAALLELNVDVDLCGWWSAGDRRARVWDRDYSPRRQITGPGISTSPPPRNFSSASSESTRSPVQRGCDLAIKQRGLISSPLISWLRPSTAKTHRGLHHYRPGPGGAGRRRVRAIRFAAMARLRSSLQDYGAIVVVSTSHEACALANELAPEHVEVVTSEMRRRRRIKTRARFLRLSTRRSRRRLMSLVRRRPADGTNGAFLVSARRLRLREVTTHCAIRQPRLTPWPTAFLFLAEREGLAAQRVRHVSQTKMTMPLDLHPACCSRAARVPLRRIVPP